MGLVSLLGLVGLQLGAAGFLTGGLFAYASVRSVDRQEAVDRYGRSAASGDDAALIRSVEDLHAAYEGLVRIVRPTTRALHSSPALAPARSPEREDGGSFHPRGSR